MADEDLRNEPLEVRRELRSTNVMPVCRANPLLRNAPASAAKVVQAIREQGLAEVIAKRRGNPYQPAERSGACVKMSQPQELVIGGYVSGVNNFDSMVV